MKNILIILLVVFSLPALAQRPFQFHTTKISFVSDKEATVRPSDIVITFHSDKTGFVVSSPGHGDAFQYSYSDMIFDEVFEKDDNIVRMLEHKEGDLLMILYSEQSNDLVLFLYFPTIKELYGLFTNNTNLLDSELKHHSLRVRTAIQSDTEPVKKMY